MTTPAVKQSPMMKAHFQRHAYHSDAREIGTIVFEDEAIITVFAVVHAKTKPLARKLGAAHEKALVGMIRHMTELVVKQTTEPSP